MGVKEGVFSMFWKVCQTPSVNIALIPRRGLAFSEKVLKNFVFGFAHIAASESDKLK